MDITIIEDNVHRPEYAMKIKINGRSLNRVVIDQHYKEKHADLNDSLILELVKSLDNTEWDIEVTKGGFQYFAVEPIIYSDKPYRLVLMLCIYDNFLGVINAFRINRRS